MRPNCREQKRSPDNEADHNGQPDRKCLCEIEDDEDGRVKHADCGVEIPRARPDCPTDGYGGKRFVERQVATGRQSKLAATPSMVEATCSA